MDLGALKENIFKIFYYVLKKRSRTWRWYGEMHEWQQWNEIYKWFIMSKRDLKVTRDWMQLFCETIQGYAFRKYYCWESRSIVWACAYEEMHNVWKCMNTLYCNVCDALFSKWGKLLKLWNWLRLVWFLYTANHITVECVQSFHTC